VNPGRAALTVLLCYAILTLWVGERWAWCLFETGIFALAAWRAGGVRRPISITPAMTLLALAAAWPLVQLAAGSTICRDATREAALTWLAYLLVFALSADLLADPPARRRTLTALSWFAAVLAFVSTLQKYSSGGKYFWLFDSGFAEDVLGPFANHNQFAAWVELIIPVSLWMACSEKRLRALHGCAAAILFGSVVASGSRAGFALACAEVLAVFGALAAKRAAPRRALMVAALQFAVVAAVAAGVAGWSTLQDRLSAPGLARLRADAARASIEMVRENPWTGTGLGTWSRVYPGMASFDPGMVMNQAHNDWLQWAAEGGVPFVVALFLFAALLWKRAVRSIYGVGTVAFLLHALVDYPMQQRPALGAWFFAISGAVAAWNGAAADHGLLRGIRRRTGRIAGRDPAGLQAARAVAASGSLSRLADETAGGTADAKAECDGGRFDGPCGPKQI
jgi:O-antigen ligase